MHLDRSYSLFTVKNAAVLLELFNLLDVHEIGQLNDIQARENCQRTVTAFSHDSVERVFKMVDNGNGQESYHINSTINKSEFSRHSKIVFGLMDEDGGGTISAEEFKRHYSRYGFLFNLNDQSIGELFQEFDVSGDDELDYKEFRMFAMACIGSLNISIRF
uniref:4930403C08Rik protein-like protein n=1 Tax=Oikopleura dioica TaxID=34765 RepID=Q675T7_OIKDI|nr:4930403C08Rik protein-like protein [Oikopleura dioica]